MCEDFCDRDDVGGEPEKSLFEIVFGLIFIIIITGFAIYLMTLC